MDKEILCTVCVISYNQERFIQQTLDSILSQKTDFRFELLISDDASKDNTQKIIKEYELQYPNIIRNISRSKNVGSQKNFYSTMEEAKGKYIALCEGDDYWIDSNKLQKQVTFLEKNPEYGLIYARAKLFHNAKQRFYRKPIGGLVLSFEDIYVKGSRIPTQTTCFRKCLFLKYMDEINPLEKNWLLGDLPLWLWFYYNSKVYYNSEIVSVYRKLESSASHSKDFEKQKLFERSRYEVRSFYKAHYNLDLPLEWNENSIDFNIAFHQFDRKRILQCTFKTLEKKEKIVWLAAHSKILFYLIKKIYYMSKGSF